MRLLQIPATNFIKKFICIPALVLASYFVFHLWQPYFKVPLFNVSESVYAEIGSQLIEGKILYKDLADNKPPAIYFLYSVFFKASGKNKMMGLHIAVALSVIFTSLFIYLILSIIENRFAGLIAAVVNMLLPTVNPSLSNFHAADTEVFMMLPVIMSIYFSIKYIYQGMNITYIFLAGLCCSFGSLMKQPAAIFILIPLSLIIFQNKDNADRKIIRAIITLFSAFCVPWICAATYFIYKHAFREFIYYVFLYNKIFIGKMGFRDTLTIAYQNTSTILLPVISVFFFAVAGFVYQLFFNNASRKKKLLWVILIITTLLNLSISRLFLGHYYYIAFPLLSMSYGSFWGGIILRAIKKARENSHLLIRAILYLAAYLILIFIVIDIAVIFIKSPKNYFIYPKTITFFDDGYIGDNYIKIASNYIAARTAVSDKIFVWGFCPAFYTLSNRRCVSRFVQCNYIVGDLPPYNREPSGLKNNYFYLQFMQDLINNKPVYFIDTSTADYMAFGLYRINKFPELDQFIGKYYYLDKTIGNINLYRIKK